jgi:hypothetical protein
MINSTKAVEKNELKWKMTELEKIYTFGYFSSNGTKSSKIWAIKILKCAHARSAKNFF